MRRIVVADDDPMVCTAIEIYLERHGFEVTLADGGEAVLRGTGGFLFRPDARRYLHAAYARLRIDQDIP